MKILTSFVGLALALLYVPPPSTDTRAGRDRGDAFAGAALAPRDDPDNVEGEDPPVPDGVSDPPEDPPPEEA